MSNPIVAPVVRVFYRVRTRTGWARAHESYLGVTQWISSDKPFAAAFPTEEEARRVASEFKGARLVRVIVRAK